MKCPSCGSENKNTNIKCEVCGSVLHPEEEDLSKFESGENPKYIERQNLVNGLDYINKRKKGIGCLSNVIISIILIPWILAGLAFIGVSLYSIISNIKVSKNYDETDAKLVDYVIKRDGEGKEYYKAIYEFEVDGVTYTASPDKEGSKNSYKKTAKVKYNPEYPNENLMASGWGGLLATGIIMEIIIAIIYIAIRRKLKGMSDIVDEAISEEISDTQGEE
ncbi:MAG: DUF3592 domain-containing protein [Lachnospiraceae bacterium]|nr:DUF3592 domain-containing protein [Lachnospiraceae bacterium]MBQ9232896.1 DUF3592 domain-containing protein [Lachnospiraceae bacterium]